MNPLIPAIISAILGNGEPTEAPPPPPQFGGLRPIPVETVKARMEPPFQGQVALGDKLLRLAPGAQIRDAQNRIVMSGALQQPVLVRYQVDDQGDVARVWILTAEEAAQPGK